jgi:hypothetical protein
MIKLTQLNEAEEMQFNQLDPQRKKQVIAFEKVIGGKYDTIFKGIHGYVIDIKVIGGHGAYRFEADIMKKLIALKVRWVEADGDYISIGF